MLSNYNVLLVVGGVFGAEFVLTMSKPTPVPFRLSISICRKSIYITRNHVAKIQTLLHEGIRQSRCTCTVWSCSSEAPGLYLQSLLDSEALVFYVFLDCR